MAVYGYMRVSTREQNEGRQRDALEKYGVPQKNVYLDKQSGKDFVRPAYLRICLLYTSQGERNDRQQGGCGTVCPQHHGQLVDKPAHGTHQPAEEQAFARTAEQNGKTQGACAGNKELRGQLPNLCTGQHLSLIHI